MMSLITKKMILGDNPATPSGPPLSLGWEYEVLPAMNITDFESFRLRSRRFHSSHLILSQYKRVEIISRVSHQYLLHAAAREWELLLEYENVFNVGEFDFLKFSSLSSIPNRIFLLLFLFLVQMGYPQKEIKKAEDEVKKVQRHRKLTMAFSPCGKLEQAFQSIGRKWKKNVVGKAKDRSKT